LPRAGEKKGNFHEGGQNRRGKKGNNGGNYRGKGFGGEKVKFKPRMRERQRIEGGKNKGEGGFQLKHKKRTQGPQNHKRVPKWTYTQDKKTK